MSQLIGLEPATAARRTTGEKLEGIAFTFCKVATVALLAGRFTLPVAAILSATFYVAGYAKGKKDTRCWLRIPLLIAGFWVTVAAVWLVFQLKPDLAPEILKQMHLG